YRDVTATYSLQEDGKVRVANRAIDGDGERQEATGEAAPVRGSHNSKLEVSFLPEGMRWIPFTKGDYWILRLDPEYRVALVGSPDRKYLWLLAREPRIDSATRLEYLAAAQAQGYELDELIDTPQSGSKSPAETTDPAAVEQKDGTYGASAGGTCPGVPPRRRSRSSSFSCPSPVIHCWKRARKAR